MKLESWLDELCVKFGLSNTILKYKGKTIRSKNDLLSIFKKVYRCRAWVCVYVAWSNWLPKRNNKVKKYLQNRKFADGAYLFIQCIDWIIMPTPHESSRLLNFDINIKRVVFMIHSGMASHRLHVIWHLVACNYYF